MTVVETIVALAGAATLLGAAGTDGAAGLPVRRGNIAVHTITGAAAGEQNAGAAAWSGDEQGSKGVISDQVRG